MIPRLDRKFAGQTVGVIVVVGAVASYPLLAFASREVVVAAAIGCSVSTLNALAGSLTMEYALDKPYTTFFKAVFGGMGARMLVLLGVLYLLIKVFDVHRVALTVSLLGFYVIFLALEVLSIQRKVEIRNRSSRG